MQYLFLSIYPIPLWKRPCELQSPFDISHLSAPLGKLPLRSDSVEEKCPLANLRCILSEVINIDTAQTSENIIKFRFQKSIILVASHNF